MRCKTYISKGDLIDFTFIGLYTASNGYFITEVIQMTRKFGQWHENSDIQDSSETESDEENEEIKDPSEVEPYDYIEAVKLTGDPDVPAGQVSTFPYEQMSLFLLYTMKYYVYMFSEDNLIDFVITRIILKLNILRHVDYLLLYLLIYVSREKKKILL